MEKDKPINVTKWVDDVLDAGVPSFLTDPPITSADIKFALRPVLTERVELLIAVVVSSVVGKLKEVDRPDNNSTPFD